MGEGHVGLTSAMRNVGQEDPLEYSIPSPEGLVTQGTDKELTTAGTGDSLSLSSRQ